MKRYISLNYINGKESINCKGEIQVINEDQYTFYIQWNVFEKDGSVIAGKVRKFNKENDLLTMELLNDVLKDIRNYRIGRKRIFSEVHFVND